jgi:hypothetical protein
VGKILNLIEKCPEDTINKKGEKMRVTAGILSSGSQITSIPTQRMPMRMSSRCTPMCTCGMLSLRLCSVTLVARPYWLKTLTVMDKKWRWGTAALAFLYR